MNSRNVGNAATPVLFVCFLLFYVTLHRFQRFPFTYSFFIANGRTETLYKQDVSWWCLQRPYTTATHAPHFSIGSSNHHRFVRIFLICFSFSFSWFSCVPLCFWISRVIYICCFCCLWFASFSFCLDWWPDWYQRYLRTLLASTTVACIDVSVLRSPTSRSLILIYTSVIRNPRNNSFPVSHPPPGHLPYRCTSRFGHFAGRSRLYDLASLDANSAPPCSDSTARWVLFL